MSDRPEPGEPAAPFIAPPPRHSWGYLSIIWLIPLAAVAIGGYLAWTTLADRGVEITIAFNTSDGVTVGTKIQHKAVELGTVTQVGLSADLSHVEIHARMQPTATPYITDKARFWVARVQFAGGSVSGLSSLVSGRTIEMDPGPPGGARQVEFKGLADPSGVQSDEPGTTFVLTAPTIKPLSSGTGVFYRDVLVGEVLESQLTEGTAAARASIFVKQPFDQRVRTGTVFWQTKGIDTDLSGRGLGIQVSSLQAALSGGVSFGLPPDAADYPPAAGGTQFTLFDDEATADRASYRRRIPFVMYFDAAVPGLAAGSKVVLLGTQVGTVTGVTLLGDTGAGRFRVRVTLDFLPQAAHLTVHPGDDMHVLGGQLLAAGLQGTAETESYVTNAQAIAIEVAPATAARPREDAGLWVLPTVPTTAGGGVASLASRLQSIKQIPFGALGAAANSMLASMASRARATTNGQQLAGVTRMILAAQASVRQTDASIGQALAGLPATADKLQRTLAQANQAVSAANAAYGDGSTLTTDIGRAMDRYYATVRQARLLADRLSQHPEAIIRGTTGQAGER